MRVHMAGPFDWLGDRVSELATQPWETAMLSIWSASVWALKLISEFIDSYTTPNVADPALANLYGVMVWLSIVTALLVGFGQIGVAVIRQDGQPIAELLMGLVRYGLIVAAWIVVCAALINVTGRLTLGIMDVTMDVRSFSDFTDANFVNSVSGTVQATVLGLTGALVVLPASFAHILVMLARAVVLVVLTISLPVLAATGLGDASKAWLFRGLRWFLTACLIAPLQALMMGIGVQVAKAGLPQSGGSDSAAFVGSSTSQNVGMSVVGSLLMLLCAFAPLALFRLFAFVDPGTHSGANLRHNLAANGGLAGLFARPAHRVPGLAAEQATDGRSSAEIGAERATAERFENGVGPGARPTTPRVLLADVDQPKPANSDPTHPKPERPNPGRSDAERAHDDQTASSSSTVSLRSLTRTEDRNPSQSPGGDGASGARTQHNGMGEPR